MRTVFFLRLSWLLLADYFCGCGRIVFFEEERLKESSFFFLGIDLKLNQIF
jgi:hypothetical protein